jgi:hypothetical protein
MAASRQFMLIQLAKRSSVDTDRIRPILDKAVDWIQVSANTWVVWTSSSPVRWHERIKKIFGSEIRVLVVVIDAEQRSGRMPKAFWDFLRTKSGEKAQSSDEL